MNNNMLDGESSLRIYTLDYMRVLATIAVIFLHVSAQTMSIVPVLSLERFICNFYDGGARFGVPLFVMISGAIFLNREIDVNTIYKKYIFRIFIAFVIWSLFYSCIEEGNIWTHISLFLMGHYHLWFLFMISGLYMCIPIVKTICKDWKLIKYWMLLAGVFSFIIPSIGDVVEDFGGEGTNSFLWIVRYWVKNTGMEILGVYLSYFMLGYLIKNLNIRKKQELL